MGAGLYLRLQPTGPFRVQGLWGLVTVTWLGGVNELVIQGWLGVSHGLMVQGWGLVIVQAVAGGGVMVQPDWGIH